MASNIVSHLNITGWTFSEYVTDEIKAAGLAAVQKILDGRGLTLASGTKIIVSYKKQYGNKGAYQASWSLAPAALAKPEAAKPLAWKDISDPEPGSVPMNALYVKPVAAKPVAVKPVAVKPEFDIASAFNAMMLANEKTAKQIAAITKRLDDME